MGKLATLTKWTDLRLQPGLTHHCLVGVELQRSMQNAQTPMVLVKMNAFDDFQVHKVILISQSKVFLTMLSNPRYRETETSTVRLVTFDHETVIHLIRWMYTGEVPECNDYIYELYCMADMYEIRDLFVIFISNPLFYA